MLQEEVVQEKIVIFHGTEFVPTFSLDILKIDDRRRGRARTKVMPISPVSS